MQLNFLNVASLVTIAVAGLVGGVFGAADNPLLCGIGAAVATALLIQVRFFYEVPAENKLERYAGLPALAVLFAGIIFATATTFSIVGGVFFGIVLTALVRRVLSI